MQFHQLLSERGFRNWKGGRIWLRERVGLETGMGTDWSSKLRGLDISEEL